jgi:hypothetical protein
MILNGLPGGRNRRPHHPQEEKISPYPASQQKPPVTENLYRPAYRTDDAGLLMYRERLLFHDFFHGASALLDIVRRQLRAALLKNDGREPKIPRGDYGG